MPNPKLLILLVGGRIQPATLLALEVQPDMVAIVASQDSDSAAQMAQQRLSVLLPSAHILPPVSVHPYRPSETRTAIETILRTQAGIQASPAISLTGATLPMSIGAYEAARRTDCPAYYLNTGGAEVLDFTGEEDIAPLVLGTGIEDFLANEGLALSPAQKKVPGTSAEDANLAELAALFAHSPHIATAVLDWLRSGSHRARERFVPGQITKRWPERFGEAEWTLLEQLQTHGIIDSLRRSTSEKSVGFQLLNSDVADFLKGNWLEAYVFSVARRLEIDGKPAFDSCRAGLRFLAGDAEREIDFIGTWRGIPLIASCKTGTDAWKKENLDEVAAVARLLGDSYCTRLLITNRTAPARESKEHNAWQNALQHALSQKVIIVTGDTLHRLAAILRKQLLTPTYPRR